MKNQHSVFAPGGCLYGLSGADFVFPNKKELWRAVSTPDHPLSEYPKLINYQQLTVKFPEIIRVDCDFNPPLVETIWRRWISFSLALVIFILVIGSVFFLFG